MRYYEWLICGPMGQGYRAGFMTLEREVIRRWDRVCTDKQKGLMHFIVEECLDNEDIEHYLSPRIVLERRLRDITYKLDEL